MIAWISVELDASGEPVEACPWQLRDMGAQKWEAMSFLRAREIPERGYLEAQVQFQADPLWAWEYRFERLQDGEGLGALAAKGWQEVEAFPRRPDGYRYWLLKRPTR